MGYHAPYLVTPMKPPMLQQLRIALLTLILAV